MTRSKERPEAKPAMENAHTEDPVDLQAGNASARSRLHAATAIQSSVTPEDYPEAERKEQVKAATGGSSGTPAK